jgi:hypothetical protein
MIHVDSRTGVRTVTCTKYCMHKGLRKFGDVRVPKTL